MESANGINQSNELSLMEFPYIVRWREDRCTRCGKCTTVCPTHAIEPTVFVQRQAFSAGSAPNPSVERKVMQGIRQVLEIDRYCTGCATCAFVCPTAAIEPEFNPRHK